MSLSLSLFINNYYEKIFNAFNLDVLNKYTLVHEDYLSGEIENDVSLLSNTSDKKILLMYDSNPNWQFEDYFLKLSERVDNVYLSSSNLLNLWGDHPRIVYFPTFYFTQLQETNYQTFNKEYRFSFLSNKPRFHRIYFYHVVKDVISDDDCFSVNNQAFDGGWWKDMYINDMRKTIGIYDKTIEGGLPFITHNAYECNKKLNTIGSLTNDHSNKHIAYNSYFNIIGETDNTVGRVFLTEKTWKAVRSGVLPIFMEYGNAFDALERIGFDFENEINIKNVNYIDKVSHIKKCMDTNVMNNAKMIYNNTLHQIENNIKRFSDDNLINLFTKHIRNKLNV